VLMMRPQPRGRMSRTANRLTANVPKQSTSMVERNSASVMLNIIRSAITPALLTTTSTPPNASTHEPTIASAPSKEATDRTHPTALPPPAVIASTTSSTRSGVVPFTSTCAPSRASARA
jgi:hypothetical protein